MEETQSMVFYLLNKCLMTDWRSMTLFPSVTYIFLYNFLQDKVGKQNS